ncbi:hypothetical protein B9G55_12025 [Saccharibacillus sp. O16]|nr:hypothetical protein B9G55_12025 [Saccharibacillus sp. O16]
MNEQQKNASINRILDQGLVEPVRAGERISSMMRELGLRFIFWDTGYSLFFAAITLGLAFALFILTPSDYLASAAVAVAPLLMLLAVSFAETSERLGGLYELKQTFRYTVRQIAAVRMMAYSAAGTLFTALVAYIGTEGEFSFLSLFSLCTAALFACATITVTLLHRTRNGWIPAGFTAIWALANLGLMFLLNDKWELLLRGIPVGIAALFAAGFAALFIWQLSKMLREVNRYVIA